MDIAKFLQSFADIVEVDPSEITAETALGSLERWDSLNLLSYMALVEEHFGHQVMPEDITSAQTVGELFALANGKAS